MHGSMRTKEDLLAGLARIEREHGGWTYDIPLPFGVWTKGNLGLPHTRLKRIVQMAADVAGKPLDQCRVLDLACLDGQFALEFALRGAQAVGIEIRPSHLAKARFAADALGLGNVAFHEDDVRNLSAAKYGHFDIVVCSGILYHLTANDAINLVYSMHEVATRALLLDTERSRVPVEAIQTPKGRTYRGEILREHAEDATDEHKQSKGWASWDNTTSFWFSRASLVNMLQHAGFTSVYECLAPVHLNYGRPGLESTTRITLMALKSPADALQTSPAAAAVREDMPEDADVAGDYQARMALAGARPDLAVAAAVPPSAPARPPGLLRRLLRDVMGRR